MEEQEDKQRREAPFPFRIGGLVIDPDAPLTGIRQSSDFPSSDEET